MINESRWLGVLLSPPYLLLCGCYIAYMTFLWWLRKPLKNAGMVDFGWPCGLILLPIFFLLTGTGWWGHRTILAAMYLFCGFRFVFGWFVRFKSGEDRRWNYWRKYWQEGNGLFGISSEDFNFFFFYQIQTLTNLLSFAVPLALVSRGTSTEGFHVLQLVAIVLWVVSFFLENVADSQLRAFKSSPNSIAGVCRVGLWSYSRHPNYFFEFMLWISYTLYALPFATGLLDYLFLATVPLIAYWFLVHHTGIPFTEQASLERRGEVFRKYQEEVSRFFPWFPKNKV